MWLQLRTLGDTNWLHHYLTLAKNLQQTEQSIRTIRDFKKKLESRERLTPLEQKLIIHSVANHMAQNQDYTRTTCDRFSRSLTSKYPEAFEIQDADDNILSNGQVTLLNRLWTYNKQNKVNTHEPLIVIAAAIINKDRNF